MGHLDPLGNRHLLHALNGFPVQPAHPSSVSSKAAEYALSGGILVVALLVIALAIHLAWHYRTWYPLLCILGGCLTALVEPVLDVGLQLYWLKHHQPDYISAFGRHVPIITLAIYIIFMGFSSMMIWLWTHQGGVSVRKLLTLYIGMIVALNILEPIGLKVHLWYYAGQHGIRFFNYPVWYSVSVSSIFLMNGAIQWRARPYLHGWLALATICLIPMVDMGQFFAIQWPMFLALNTQPALIVTYICSAIAVAQGFLVVYLAMALVGVISPQQATTAEARAPRSVGPAPAPARS
jgi:hypothetical protein